MKSKPSVRISTNAEIDLRKSTILIPDTAIGDAEVDIKKDTQVVAQLSSDQANISFSKSLKVNGSKLGKASKKELRRQMRDMDPTGGAIGDFMGSFAGQVSDFWGGGVDGMKIKRVTVDHLTRGKPEVEVSGNAQFSLPLPMLPPLFVDGKLGLKNEPVPARYLNAAFGTEMVDLLNQLTQTIKRVHMNHLTVSTPVSQLQVRNLQLKSQKALQGSEQIKATTNLQFSGPEGAIHVPVTIQGTPSRLTLSIPDPTVLFEVLGIPAWIPQFFAKNAEPGALEVEIRPEPKNPSGFHTQVRMGGKAQLAQDAPPSQPALALAARGLELLLKRFEGAEIQTLEMGELALEAPVTLKARPTASNDIPTPSIDTTMKLPDDRNLSYAVYGAPQGRPVLFVPGILTSRTHASLFDAAAKARGVKIIGVERPGYGRSSPMDNFTPKSVSEDLQCLMNALAPEGYGILGHSGGGPTAQTLAGLDNQRVRQVVLAAANVPPKTAEEAEVLTAGADEGLGHFSDDDMHGLSQPGILAQFIHGLRELQNGAAVNDRDIANNLNPDNFPDLEAIEAPVTVIHPKDDPLVPHARGLLLKEGVKNLDHRTISGAAHLFLFSQPEMVLEPF